MVLVGLLRSVRHPVKIPPPPDRLLRYLLDASLSKAATISAVRAMKSLNRCRSSHHRAASELDWYSNKFPAIDCRR